MRFLCCAELILSSSSAARARESTSFSHAARAHTARVPGPCIRAPSARCDCLGACHNAHWVGAALISWSHGSTHTCSVLSCACYAGCSSFYTASLLARPAPLAATRSILSCKTIARSLALADCIMLHLRSTCRITSAAGGVRRPRPSGQTRSLSSMRIAHDERYMDRLCVSRVARTGEVRTVSKRC